MEKEKCGKRETAQDMPISGRRRRKSGYVRELRAAIRDRRGEVPLFLGAAINTVAGLMAMEEAMLEAIIMDGRANLVSMCKGSAGQLKMEQNPLVATYLTVVRQLMHAYRLLGIGGGLSAGKADGEGKPDALGEFIKSMGGGEAVG